MFNTTEIGTPGVAINALNRPLANPPYVECRHVNPFGWWQLNAANNFVWVSSQNPILQVTPIRLAGNKIAFRTADSSGLILQSVSLSGLQALGTGTSILANARFGVEEPVAFRTISEVKYNEEDSRVYNIALVEKYKDERSNSSSVEQTGSFRVAYKKSTSNTWGDSVSLTTGITASMSASIPFVGIDFEVSYSQERTQTVEFGKVEEEEEEVEYVQNVTIPSRTKITLLVVATQVQCDVPFTCRVVDTYFDGTTNPYTKTDGLFSGSNEFSFNANILEEDI